VPLLHIEFPVGKELAASATHLMASIEVHLMIVYGCVHSCINNREACMILNIRLHTLGVTLFSMTLRDLNLVLLMNWRLLGNSLRRSLQKLSWKISCMQFGILIYFNPFHDWLTKLPAGTAYPWTALVPFYLQNWNFSIKGQAEVSPNELMSHLVGFGEIVYH